VGINTYAISQVVATIIIVAIIIAVVIAVTLWITSISGMYVRIETLQVVGKHASS